MAAVGGRILPQFLAPPPDWMRGAQLEYTTLPDYGTQPFDMRSGRLPVGANMAVRRELLTSRPMPFEERLGHRGGMAIGFEERYLLEVLVREHRVVYAPRPSFITASARTACSTPACARASTRAASGSRATSA